MKRRLVKKWRNALRQYHRNQDRRTSHEGLATRPFYTLMLIGNAIDLGWFPKSLEQAHAVHTFKQVHKFHVN